MSSPKGFTFTQLKNGDVVISHHGKRAAVLRDRKASKFLRDIETRDPQQVMARLTGNYKRGNERR